MRLFLSSVDTLNDWVGKVVRWLVIVMMGVLVWEVVLRYAFSAPTNWAHETSGFLFGAFFFLGGGYTLLKRGHVNVDILYTAFPLRMRAIVDLVTWLLFFLFVAVLLWKCGEAGWTSLQWMERSGSTWDPPVWPIKLIIPLGGFFLLLQGVAKYIRDLTTAITGKEAA